MRSHSAGPVLILAPKGRDAPLAAEILGRSEIETLICPDLGALAAALGPETGAIVLAEEALGHSPPSALKEKLSQQEPWSDLPVLLLTFDGTARRTADFLEEHAGVIPFALLERPFRVATFVSAVQAALRTRQRQREVRDLLSQRNEAQEALAESDERLRVATAAADIGTWDFSPGTGSLIWDDRCRAHFGIRAGTPMTYEIFLSGLHPDDRERADAAVRMALAPGGPGHYQIEYRTIGLHDGIERWVAATGRVGIHPQSNAVRFSGTAIDITARKLAEIQLETALEELEAANEAKDHFLATLSHELRTPLTPILLSLSELDLARTRTAELREILAMIRRNVELEARLIDDLLDLTRIARGKLELHSDVVDGHSLLRAAIDVCGDIEFTRRRLVLNLQAEAAEHHVWADGGRLQQVFWNLLHNAIKFTPEGGIITVRTSNPRPGIVSFEIRDTGIGIDPARIARIFSAFEQGDRAITRRFGGLGLGLAICRAIVDLHEGVIRAASDGEGCGATFTIELATVAPKPAADPVAQRSDGLPLIPGRLLLVEDHASTAEVITKLLRRTGHTVQAADCVAQARRLLTEAKFDLVISDLGLPDGTGLELMKHAAEYGLPGIALSGYGMDHDVRACLEAGFLAHLTKPVDWHRLREVIQKILAGEPVALDGTRVREADQPVGADGVLRGKHS